MDTLSASYILNLISNIFITGWGKIKHPGSSVNVLRQSHLRVVDRDTCNNLNQASTGLSITDKMVCAGYGPGNPRGGCHGDSGGPFVCQRDDGIWQLQGAVSWGSGTCNTNVAYTVFAKVSAFIPWIYNSISGGKDHN